MTLQMLCEVIDSLHIRHLVDTYQVLELETGN